MAAILLPGMLALAQEETPRQGPSLLAPQPARTPDAKKCVVAGTVTRPGGDETVRRAMITLIPQVGEGSDRGDDSGEYVGTTDTNGRFEFAGVNPGTYTVVVERNGLSRVRTAGDRIWSPFVTLELSAGEERRDVVLELQPGVTISGTVKDENGEPMHSVVVRALHPVNNEGRHVVWPAGTATSNDRGEYRISGLASGTYLLEAVPSTPRSNNRGYPHVYYPDATLREQATAIRLSPGDETVADFMLVPVPLGTIRGHVIGLHPQNARIIAGMRGGELSRQVHVAQNGYFELNGLLPGEYTLRAYETSGDNAVRIGTRSIRLESGEVDTTDITAVPTSITSTTLEGNIKVVDGNLGHGSLSSLNVNLIPEPSGSDMDPSGGMRASASVDESGRIVLEDVSPGRYTVHITASSAGWEDFYTNAVRISGRDVTDSPFVIPTGGGKIPIEIAIAGDGGYVEGTVTDEDDKPVPNAVVTGIPDTPLRNQLDCYQQARADRQGHYRLRGVRPGPYTLYAWESMEDSSFMDAEFMHAYESQGVAVKLNAKEHQTVPLKLIVASP